MFISHYGAHILDRKERLWPSSVVRFTDGRAMPLFLMLAGAGCTFLCRRPGAAVRVLSRAVLLLLAGLWLEGGLVAVILHFYALYLVVGLLVARVPKSVLLALAAVTAAAGAWVRIYAVDDLPTQYRITDDSWWSALPHLGHPDLLFSHLAFTGIYPALPTLTFFFVGMWLARLDLRSVRVVLALVSAGIVMAIAGYGLGWTTDDRRVGLDPDSTSSWRLLSAAGHSQMPVWVVATTGVSLAVIGLCLWVCARLPRPIRPLAAAGQLALTFYIVHVFLLRRGLREWPWQMSHAEILGSIAAIYLVFVALAWLWRLRWRYGPAEAVLRIGDTLARHPERRTARPSGEVWVERLSDPTRPRG
jgi:uncharacterized membrane protein YeiB